MKGTNPYAPDGGNHPMAAEPSQAVQRWADAAMYRSEPMPTDDGRVVPRVTLVNATRDPLGSLAALYAIYDGRVVRDLAEVSDQQRLDAFEDITKTELQGPLESIQFHFLVEGVTRAFTHQMVRERQAFFAQESMRFAVVDEESWAERSAYPPTLAAEPDPEAKDGPEFMRALARDSWDYSIAISQRSYNQLIERGVPAEDARGLMPHAMTTRLHWVLSLRSLLHVAGLRLCTQAQFEWRLVMASLVKSLRQEVGVKYLKTVAGETPDGAFDKRVISDNDAWQFELIADRLRPVCYQKGQCGFMAKFDRGCTIRERVDANGRYGRPSNQWHRAMDLGPSAPRAVALQLTPSLQVPWSMQVAGEEHDIIPAIDNADWAANPYAARGKR